MNRAADDIDPELVEGEWPTPLTVSDYSRRGMGLIRRHALPGVPMYSGRLSVADIQSRIDTCYRPYRLALAARDSIARIRSSGPWCTSTRTP